MLGSRQRAGLVIGLSRPAIALRATLILVLIASGTTLIPALAAAKQQTREIKVAEAPAPPPPLPDALREPVTAKIQSQGDLNPKIIDLKIQGDPTELLQGLVEDPAARTEFGNVYQVQGVDHFAAIYDHPVNYQDDKGLWTPISSKLVDDGKGGLKNEANAFTTDFPAKLSQTSPVVITVAKGSYTFAPKGAGLPVALTQGDDTSLSYAGILPSVDLAYHLSSTGFDEAVTLQALGAVPPVFEISSTDLSFRLEKTGEVSILSGDALVGLIPPPTATDATFDPEGKQGGSGLVSFGLTDLGGGAWELSTVLDPTFLATAKYPVVVDPIYQTLTPGRDTWVDEAVAGASYESGVDSYELRAGNLVSTKTRYGFLNFFTSGYTRSKRVVFYAYMDLYATYVANPGVDVNVRRVTGAWPNSGSLTWNTKPAAGTTVYDAQHGVAGWYQFDLTGLYKNIIDTDNNWTNYGVRIGGDSASPLTDNYHRFASSKYSDPNAKPVLFLSYNDPPDVPGLEIPVDGKVFTYSSPTLHVQTPLTDHNNDPVRVNYQVSTSQTDFSAPVVESGWLLQTVRWAVPAGVLHDGTTYWWRAQVDDVCDTNTDALCSMMGAEFVASVPRSFTIALNHFGTNDQWPMWKTSLGNAMTLAVNEASGNLSLNYPLDSLPTPAGALDLGLSYNHQDGTDNGLGQGWWISAGPGSNPKDLPVKLTEVDSGDAVRITLRDGDENYFSKLTSSGSAFYQGGGTQSGTVKKNTDGTWLFSTDDGGQYTFSSSGNLATANPATNTVASKGFSYAFSANGHIQTVTDPLGRVITFHWDTGDAKLLDIKTWETTPRTWTIAYDPTLTTMIKTVTDPEGGVVTFEYNNTPRRLTKVTDGAGMDTTVSYASPTGPPKSQVAWVQAPGYGVNDRTDFEYKTPYTGQVAAQALVHDPRWIGGSDGAYTTTIDIDKNGLPVRISGPANNAGTLPVTTMVWDTNGNLVCRRGPAANGMTPIKCLATDTSSDGLQTDYTYDTRAPYRLLTLTGPDADQGGPGTRPIKTYAYDETLTGLVMTAYNNNQMTGLPAYQTVDPILDHDWGTGAPTGLTATDNFSIRWSGLLHVDTTKKYHFRLGQNDGATLVVNGAVLTDCFGQTYGYSAYNCGSGADATIKLTAGDIPIQVNYSELLDSAKVTLKWDEPTAGTFVAVPTANLKPGLGSLTAETDPLGTTSYVYSNPNLNQARHLPSGVTRSGAGYSSRTTSYTYDTYGRVLTDTNDAGILTNVFQPDTSGKDCLDTVTDRASAVTTYLCDAAGDVTSLTLAVPAKDSQPSQSRVALKSYDLVGRLKSVETTDDASVTRTITYAYDGAGRLTQATDSISTGARITTYDYDTHGRLWHETLPDPDGGGSLTSPVTTHVYDQMGNETKTTDAKAKDWTKTYDAANRVTCSANPYGNCLSDPTTGAMTTTIYDDTGEVAGGTAGIPTVKVTDPAGVIGSTKMDLVGRKTSSQLGSLAAETYVFDSSGDVTKVTDPTGVYTTSTYTPFGEVRTTTTRGGPSNADAVTTYDYDTAGRLTQVTLPDPDGLGSLSAPVTTYGYDAMGRISAVTPPDLATGEVPWAVDYDAAGERVRVTDPNGRVRDWTYDTLAKLSTYRETRASGYVCPRSGTNVCKTTYHYDGFGQLTSVDDPRNSTLYFTYDNLSRKLSRYAVLGSLTIDAESYGYNAISQMTSAVAGSTTTTTGFDDAGRLASVGQSGGSTSYTYTNDQLTSRIDPAGTTSVAYDANGRVSDVTTPFSSTMVHYTYDAAGRQLVRTDPSGLTTTRSYDSPFTGRLLSEGVTGATGSYSFALSYDAGGNVLTQNQAIAGNADSGTWTYAYDGQNRLKTAQLGTNAVTTYGYDGAGNRSSVKVGTGSPVTTSYDPAGLPTSSSDGSSFAFDAVGNLTAVAGSRTWSFTFDSWNRTKTAVAGGGSPSLTYAYDALDRMIQRQRNAATVNYKYVGTTADVASAAGGSTTTYASGVGGPVAQSNGGTVKVYVPNPHGDLALIADTSAHVTGTQAYKPFGEKGATTGDTSIFSFQSDVTDGDTGFVGMGTRSYDPQVGRFSTKDVLFGDLRIPLSLNQYTYGVDNPVSLVDPDGRCPHDPDNPGVCSQTAKLKDVQATNPFWHPEWHVGESIDHHHAVPPPPPGAPRVRITFDTQWVRMGLMDIGVGGYYEGPDTGQPCSLLFSGGLGVSCGGISVQDDNLMLRAAQGGGPLSASVHGTVPVRGDTQVTVDTSASVWERLIGEKSVAITATTRFEFDTGTAGVSVSLRFRTTGGFPFAALAPVAVAGLLVPEIYAALAAACARSPRICGVEG